MIGWIRSLNARRSRITGVAASWNPVCQGTACCAMTPPEPVVSDQVAAKTMVHTPLARDHLRSVISMPFSHNGTPRQAWCLATNFGDGIKADSNPPSIPVVTVSVASR